MSFSGSERLYARTEFDKNMSKCNITMVKSPKLSFPEGVLKEQYLCSVF